MNHRSIVTLSWLAHFTWYLSVQIYILYITLYGFFHTTSCLFIYEVFSSCIFAFGSLLLIDCMSTRCWYYLYHVGIHVVLSSTITYNHQMWVIHMDYYMNVCTHTHILFNTVRQTRKTKRQEKKKKEKKWRVTII